MLIEVRNDCETGSDDSILIVRPDPQPRAGIKLFSSSDEVIPEPADGKYFRIHHYYYLPDLTRGKLPF